MAREKVRKTREARAFSPRASVLRTGLCPVGDKKPVTATVPTTFLKRTLEGLPFAVVHW